MSMQPKAWMTSYLFSAWISHFSESMQRYGGISPNHCHLLILDRFNFYITLDVVHEAKSMGLDLVTLPPTHALQPLDVTVFQRFKQYMDYWTFRNLNQLAIKDTLAQWVSLGLKRILSAHNICKGFNATRIFLLKKDAINHDLSPSEAFTKGTNMAGGKAAYGHEEHGKQYKRENEIGTNDLNGSPILSLENIDANFEQV